MVASARANSVPPAIISMVLRYRDQSKESLKPFQSLSLVACESTKVCLEGQPKRLLGYNYACVCAGVEKVWG